MLALQMMERMPEPESGCGNDVTISRFNVNFSEKIMPPFPTKRILGVRFFDGAAPDAVDYITRFGGYTVVPAAPALVKIEDDPTYRRTLVEADLAIADSGFMVLLWRLLQRRTIARISGLNYLRILLAKAELRERGSIFLVLPHQSSLEKTLVWLREEGFDIANDDCYIAPDYSVGQALPPAGTEQRQPGMVALQITKSPIVEDQDLVSIIEQRKPAHVIIGIGGGVQEKLGFYLRERLSYRPAIHCIGAALAFVTGDQKPIPMWADRIYLGWFLRLARAPHHYARRFAPAFRLPGMIWRFGSEMPPLKITK
jgi:UDP-N-acetyl-D-mannosaminuronic acid transferase (WecB/TagA/CpsF family)